MTVRILTGDALTKLRELPDESAHCVVTSPPYWGQRDYGVNGQLGLEPTLSEHVAVMVEVFREVRRVMRHDATLWLNYGDMYRNKQLQGAPWKLAFALQADGWFLRQDIIFAKPNPMPESIRDRCTKAHEYLFLLSKSPRYYFDAEAIKEPGEMKPQNRFTDGRGDKDEGYAPHRRAPGMTECTSRNKRSVWEIATEAYPESHFATFPIKLVEPCIKAGTSEKGCCAKCGAPWMREIAREFVPQPDVSREKGIKGAFDQKPMDASNSWDGFPRGSTNARTLGWSPSCSCFKIRSVQDVLDACDYTGDNPVPCTVLDPFGGAGTTGLVADRLQRNAILIELSPQYAAMAEKRISGDNPLFSTIAAE